MDHRQRRFDKPVDRDQQMTAQQIEQLVLEHGAALRLFAATWCRCPDDCVQQAFVKLTLEHPPPSNPVAWLFRVTKNEAISWHRSEGRRRRREAAVAGVRNDWFDPAPKSEIDTDALAAALERWTLSSAKSWWRGFGAR